MFIFKMDTMFRAFEDLMPDHWSILSSIAELRNDRRNKIITDQEFQKQLIALFDKFVKISIDYGIMEKFQTHVLRLILDGMTLAHLLHSQKSLRPMKTGT